MNLAKIGEHDRRIANMIRFGRVVSADYSNPSAPRVVVALGKNKTAPLPWLSGRAGNNKVWDPPEVGEQVVVLAPSGNLSAGVVLSGGVFKSDFPANGSSANVTRTDFQDGASIVYDREAHEYTLAIPSGGKATIQAGDNAKAIVQNDNVTLSFGSGVSLVINSSGITMTAGGGSLTLSSSGVSVEGLITASGEITGNGIPLSTHTHSAVQTGAGVSGPPVP